MYVCIYIYIYIEYIQYIYLTFIIVIPGAPARGVPLDL